MAWFLSNVEYVDRALTESVHYVLLDPKKDSLVFTHAEKTFGWVHKKILITRFSAFQPKYKARYGWLSFAFMYSFFEHGHSEISLKCAELSSKLKTSFVDADMEGKKEADRVLVICLLS